MVGPRADEARIPGIDISLGDGETWMFGEQAMLVLDTPGHTRGKTWSWPGEKQSLVHLKLTTAYAIHPIWWDCSSFKLNFFINWQHSLQRSMYDIEGFLVQNGNIWFLFVYFLLWAKGMWAFILKTTRQCLLVTRSSRLGVAAFLRDLQSKYVPYNLVLISVPWFNWRVPSWAQNIKLKALTMVLW